MKPITMLRTVHYGALYLKRGASYEVPSALADQLISAKSATPVLAKKS